MKKYTPPPLRYASIISNKYDFRKNLADFFIDRSRIGLLGTKQRDEAFVGVALWAWPCGRDLWGVAKARFAC